MIVDCSLRLSQFALGNLFAKGFTKSAYTATLNGTECVVKMPNSNDSSVTRRFRNFIKNDIHNMELIATYYRPALYGACLNIPMPYAVYEAGLIPFYYVAFMVDRFAWCVRIDLALQIVKFMSHLEKRQLWYCDWQPAQVGFDLYGNFKLLDGKNLIRGSVESSVQNGPYAGTSMRTVTIDQFVQPLLSTKYYTATGVKRIFEDLRCANGERCPTFATAVLKLEKYMQDKEMQECIHRHRNERRALMWIALNASRGDKSKCVFSWKKTLPEFACI